LGQISLKRDHQFFHRFLERHNAGCKVYENFLRLIFVQFLDQALCRSPNGEIDQSFRKYFMLFVALFWTVIQC